MKMLSNLFLIFSLGLTLSLTSCNKGSQLEFDDQLIDPNPAFDKQKFIEQSQVRGKDDIKAGPKIAKDTENKRKDYRKLVNKEESFDYVDIAVLEKNNFKASLNVENIDIRTFSEMVSKLTGMNILVSDEVGGRITAKLQNVYWSNMLDSILQTKKLAKHVDNKSKIIRIHDQTTVVQLEEFERKRKENVQRALLLKKASQPLFTEIFKLFYTKPDRVKTVIDEVLANKGLSVDGIRNINPEITVDDRRNLLIVKARKEDMEVISKLVEELDTRTRQVYIEAFIVEVNDDFERVLGSRLGLERANANAVDGSNAIGVGGIAGTNALPLALGSTDSLVTNLAAPNPLFGLGFIGGIGSSGDQLKVELTALESQGLTKVISNPKIFTLDNQEATIFQGDEIPYETVSDEGTKIEFKDAGLRLAVTPTIIGDGNLLLNLQINKDTANTAVDNPPITKSEIKTSLVTMDGAVVVLGGIYTESEAKGKDKVPGLGDVPGVGKLFSRDSKEDGKKELIIFIAPKVL
jgi:type IV pilus assembly protein PilQ